MHPCMHIDVLAFNNCTHAGTRHSFRADATLTVATIPKFSVLSNLQFGGVGGGDTVSRLHAVAFLQLGQSAHQAGIGCVQ